MEHINPIKIITRELLAEQVSSNAFVLFIDEAQRLRDNQLKFIIAHAEQWNIPVVFSYDTKQYLKTGETKDIFEYLKTCHPNIVVVNRTLKNKIRTNPDIASFITNMFTFGKSNSNLNYKDVTIDYFQDFATAKLYIAYLNCEEGWTPLTYTSSLVNTESITKTSTICEAKAHDVIGQEFDKVVFVMDKNFRYNENGRLEGLKTYYSLQGMLYQIVTRVVNKLKIIVLDNPELYATLLKIKAFDPQEN